MEFGEGCSVQGGFGGWYAAVFLPTTTMQPDSVVKGGDPMNVKTNVKAGDEGDNIVWGT